MPYNFKTEKRASPTVTKNGTWNLGGNGVQPTIFTSSQHGFRWGMSNVSAGGTSYAVNDATGTNITADSEL